MTPQFIRTEGGEELVVLTRRAYDALLARLGDAAAEDRATARMVEDYRIERAAGRGAVIPHWFAVAAAEQGSTAKAARRHAGASRKDTARILGIPQSRLVEIESGRAELSDDQRSALSLCTGVAAEWLV